MTADEMTITPAQQAGQLLTHVAGYVGHRTIALGLRRGLIGALADAGSLTPDELAGRLALDPFYVAVWCRAAFASGVCDTDENADPPGPGSHYRLAPHVAPLLLDTTHPGYLGGVYGVLEQPEVVDGFAANLSSGDRMWWEACSADWIEGVADTGIPFYTRLVPDGLEHVPGLASRLAAGGLIVDTACGSGAGLIRLAHTYPNSPVVGVDGDRHSLDRAAVRIRDAGLDDRVRLVHTPLEELALADSAACVLNNISMHECRDIDRVTTNVQALLEPGGWFVISDFPFPDSASGLRSVPGRVMCGIQYFEARIGDQLLARSAYDDLLARHGFADIAHVVLTPMHALTFGRVGG